MSDVMTPEELAAHDALTARQEAELEAILAHPPLALPDALRAMALLEEWTNWASRHEYADRILLAVIHDPALAAAFTALDKWYD